MIAMPTHRRHRRGYVLVVTLGLLMLSTTLLVAVGRAAVRHALAAREAGEELQRRWGTASCRNAILPFAENILANAEARQRRPVPTIRANLVLGDQSFAVVVSDEQAKANINTLLESAADQSAVEVRVRQAFAGTGLGNSIKLRLAPLNKAGQKHRTTQPAASQPSNAPAGVPRWISGLGQLFDNITPDRLVSGDGSAAVDRITCWGTGAINIMRAGESSRVLAASPPLSRIDIGRLIDARNARLVPASGNARLSAPLFDLKPGNTAPADPIGRLLSEARIDMKYRPKLALTTASSCHSLWVIVGDRKRAWYYLVVSDESNPQQPQVASFLW